MIRDLFDAPPIGGLRYQRDVLTKAEEGNAIEQIGLLDLSPFRFQGWIGKRLTRSFGWRYDFDDASFAETDPFPDWLLQVRDPAGAFAGIEPDAFVHALIVRYDPGAGIGWHRDRPVFELVVGLSLGTPAILRFRQRMQGGFRRASVKVEPRSAYLLEGDARHQWEHSIAPGDHLRFSITFRTLSQLGRRKASSQLEAGHAFRKPTAGGQC